MGQSEDGRGANDAVTQTQRKARDQFAASAAAYVASVGHAKGADLPKMVEAARLRLGSLVGRQALDIASGGGHTARALAEAGAAVTVSDLTPEMLAAAEPYLRGALPQAELRFVEAAAEALPFDSEAFDIVTCRIAAHHFGDPRAFLAEAKRVLVPGGVFILVDNIAPEDSQLGQSMNEVERLRDPSHVEAYPVSRWVSWAAEVGLEPFLLERFWRFKEFSSWLERAHTSGEDEVTLRAYLRGAPERVRRYLIESTGAEAGAQSPDSGKQLRLRHEVMMLAASSGPVGLGASPLT